MDCFDRYKTRMNIYGGNIRGEKVRNSLELISNTFNDDAAFNSGLYIWEHGLEDYTDQTQINIRLYNRIYSDANGWRMKFQTTKDSPVIAGDILYDSNEEEYYICTESYNIDNIHFQGRLTLCNWILKWQNENGDILKYPCFTMNTTQYNSGEKSNREFTIGSSQHMILLPSDENTVCLNSPQRFYLDKNTEKPTTYIVTQNDTTSYNIGKKGIVRLTVYENARDSDTDRPDLGICDYVEKGNLSDSDNTEKADKAVIKYDSIVIKSGGDKQKFTGLFYNDNEQLIEESVNWEIMCDFENKLEVSKSDNNIFISIDDDDYIDEEFKLILFNNDRSIESEIVIKIESLL